LFNLIISLPYLLTGIFISVFGQYIYWLVFEKTGSSTYVSLYVSFGYLFLSGFIIVFNRLLVHVSKKNILILFNIISIFFLYFIQDFKSSLITLFVCYIFFISHRYIEQSCRFSYAKNIITNTEKYKQINSLLEFNRQSITLFSGVFFILLGSFIDTNSIVAIGFIFLSTSLICNFFLKKDFAVEENKIESQKSKEKVPLKDIWLTFLLSIPYITNVSITVTLPSYFNLLTDNPTYYLASLVPYGIGAIIGSFFHFKGISKVIASFMICSGFFVLSVVYPSILNGYILLFFLALSNSAVRVYRNVIIMSDFNKVDAYNLFNNVESICILSIFLFSILLGIFIDSYNIYACLLFLGLYYLIWGCIIFLFKNSFKKSI
jgi:MFS family permease